METTSLTYVKKLLAELTIKSLKEWQKSEFFPRPMQLWPIYCVNLPQKKKREKKRNEEKEKNEKKFLKCVTIIQEQVFLPF